MSPEPAYPYPPAYYLALVELAAEPPFESAHEQTTYWGRQWGAADEVGPLRSVLMRKLRDEWSVVRDDCWDERCQALMDPAGRWYWDDRVAPDIAKAQAQQQGLIDVLEAQGVEVHLVEGYDPAHVRGIYTRDPLVTVPGGAILGRLAPTMADETLGLASTQATASCAIESPASAASGLSSCTFVSTSSLSQRLIMFAPPCSSVARVPAGGG